MMAKLITKFKYLKPDRKKKGGYARYIATREGVEKIDDSQKNEPATDKQQHFIEKITEDYPEVKELLEYEDYSVKPTIGNASELISRAMEQVADDILDSKTYADYIATRPRVQRFGSHGLFTDEDETVNLRRVSEELNLHDGNVWTAVVSLRREDAERLGYDSGERWRDMLRAHAQEFSEQFHIPTENLRWFAAFHNESYHPHVHLIIYSTDSQYALAKLLLNNDSENYDPESAVDWLKELAERGNLYAAQLLYYLRHSKNPSVAIAAFRLLQHLARIIQNRIEDERKSRENMTDKKLRRKIDAKREAHDLKHG